MGKHCGYQGKGFFAKLSRAVIPDQICGVYIGFHCRDHDISWDKEANKRGDLALMNGIYEEFKKAKSLVLKYPKFSFKEMRFSIEAYILTSDFRYFNEVKEVIGFFVSKSYYYGVRIGGIPPKIKHFLQGYKNDT